MNEKNREVAEHRERRLAQGLKVQRGHYCRYSEMSQYEGFKRLHCRKVNGWCYPESIFTKVCDHFEEMPSILEMVAQRYKNEESM